ncbi:MAG: guanylate kinase [Cyanobacteria bacterium P01_D01_bin.73]
MDQTQPKPSSTSDEASGLEEVSGQLIVLTGPSGVGKGTLVKALLENHGDELFLSVSATTRSPRSGEVDGQHYYFFSREQFEGAIEDNELLEWAEFAGNYYGTPLKPIEERIAKGERILLEIELEGARQVAKVFPEALRIFVLPPSMDELERRLRSRGQDSDEAINRRLERAKVEVDAAGEFNVTVVNDELPVALDSLRSLLFSTPQVSQS